MGSFSMLGLRGSAMHRTQLLNEKQELVAGEHFRKSQKFLDPSGASENVISVVIVYSVTHIVSWKTATI